MIIATCRFAMGYLAPGEMFDNMLKLMYFSVYFEGVLNTNSGYFHIKLMMIVCGESATMSGCTVYWTPW